MQEDRQMRFAKTWAVAAGAAAVLGGLGVGVASADGSSPAPKATVTSVAPAAPSSSSSREAEARGRVAEGETHARHTGLDDGTGATRTAEPGDDHGSGGHGADD
jgi:hypothetical protein